LWNSIEREHQILPDRASGSEGESNDEARDSSLPGAAISRCKLLHATHGGWQQSATELHPQDMSCSPVGQKSKSTVRKVGKGFVECELLG
jgi:hypothetical protein